MKTKTIWLVPLCWALFWASCTDDGAGGRESKFPQRERDARYGPSALASSLAVGLIIREMLAREVKS